MGGLSHDLANSGYMYLQLYTVREPSKTAFDLKPLLIIKRGFSDSERFLVIQTALQH